MSRLQNSLQEKLKKESMDSLKSTALNRFADKLYSIKSKSQKEDKEISQKGCPNGATQEFIPIKTIVDGIIITTTGRYVAISEFCPIDFHKKSPEQQEQIINMFANIFRNGPLTAQLQIITDKYYPNQFIKNIRNHTKDEKDKARVEAIQDYIEQIYKESEEASLVKRFFFIIQYDRNSENNSYERDEIIATLKQNQKLVEAQLNRCGNIVLSDGTNNNIGEILYYFFNRTSCRRQDFKNRAERITKDYKKYNELTGSNKQPAVVDVIAPKGIYFDSSDYMFIDGLYYSFLGIKSEGWSRIVPDGWVEMLNSSISNIDITIHFKKLPRQVVEKAVKFKARSHKQRVYEKSKRRREDSAQKAAEAYKEDMQVVQALSQKDDMYNVAIILTLKAESPKMLSKLKSAIIKSYKDTFDFEDSWMCTEEYFKATMPFLDAPGMLMSRLNKNLTSTNIGSMYPFIAFELVDTDGYLLGVDEDPNSSSLVIVNNFAKRFNNGHTIIVGMSGVGKSFTEKLIAGRSSLNGMRVTCICPAKGFEYKPLCDNYGGAYVDLIPSSPSCLNPMEIRAESDDLISNEEVTDIDRQKATASLLTKKLAVLNVWFKLNLAGKGDSNLSAFTAKEATEMSILLSKVYAKFGITGDNKSLFDENGKKRRMPILQNWYEALLEDQNLSKFSYVLQPYIDGVAANLNGQTNVDLSKLVTVYNVDGEIIPEELLPAYIYLAFQSSYERIKEDIYIRDLLILDEVWQMMKVKECAEQVRDAIKLMRSYNGSCLIATQELSDFFGKSGDFGKAVINNSDFKIFMHMGEGELSVIRQYYRLDNADEEAILDFEKGEALLIAGANKVKIKVKIKPTDRELRAYNTDRNNKV